MRKPVAIVTGAGGEIGRLLVPALVKRGFDVVGLDLTALPETVREQCLQTAEMNILDTAAMGALMRRHAPQRVFHLAALLSSHSERDPDLAHHVNVDGTLGLLKLCSNLDGGPARFLFPSSIAVYGLPDAATKAEQGAVKEWQWTTPRGIYGCNKLYCELVGAFMSKRAPESLDFRALRFPGLISADTLPTGGTTDFAPEMIHAAAQGKDYSCFVSRESRLPFMTMPDAVEALIALAETDPSALSTRAYNIKGFSCSAAEIRSEILGHFPEAEIGFGSVPAKQEIVDSWPADVDDTRARRDWNLSPRHDLTRAFGAYLVPALRQRYARTPI